jgi:hypothetical protein
MLENVQFYPHLHFKIAKSAIMIQKFFFLEKYQYGYQKNAEFYADVVVVYLRWMKRIPDGVSASYSLSLAQEPVLKKAKYG